MYQWQQYITMVIVWLRSDPFARNGSWLDCDALSTLSRLTLRHRLIRWYTDYYAICCSLQMCYYAMVITARIRRIGKVIFSLCVSIHTSTGSTPSRVWTGEGYSSLVWIGGVPNPSCGWGVPHPRSGGGGYPGVPLHPGLDGVPPIDRAA